MIIAGLPCNPSVIIPFGTNSITRYVALYVTNSVVTTNMFVTGTNQVSSETCTVITNYANISTNYDSRPITNFIPQGVAITANLPATFYSVTNNATNSIDFVVLFKHEAPATKTITMTLLGKATPEAAVTINRDINGKFSGIDIKPGQHLTEQQLLEAIEAVLKKSETPPKSIIVLEQGVLGVACRQPPRAKIELKSTRKNNYGNQAKSISLPSRGVGIDSGVASPFGQHAMRNLFCAVERSQIKWMLAPCHPIPRLQRRIVNNTNHSLIPT